MDEQLKELLEQINSLQSEIRSKGENTELTEKLSSMETRFNDLHNKIEAMDKRSVEANRPEGISPIEGVQDTEYRSAFESYLTTGSDLEVRGLGGADHAEGGALVPVDFETKLTEEYREENVLRKYVKAQPTSRDRVFIPKSGGTTVAWGKNKPTKQNLSTDGIYIDIVPAKTLVVVAQDTVDDAVVSIEGVVTEEMVPAFAEAEQDKWINGTGTDEPLGLLKTTALTSAPNKTGIADNIPATDVEIVKMLASAKFSIPSGARKRAIWTMNSNTLSKLFVVKDGEQKLIMNGKMFGTDTIEVIESMPDIAAGKYPIAYGDWSAYKVRDRKGMRIKVITGGDYDSDGEIGYLGQLRQGGAVANTKAFKLIKVSA